MARYIDADKLMELSQDVPIFDREMQVFGCFSGVSDEDIKSIPTADVVEVKHGSWKKTEKVIDGGKHIYKVCSICGACQIAGLGLAKYCYDCGAKMDGERK